MGKIDDAKIHLTEVMNENRRTNGRTRNITLMAVESLAILHEMPHEIGPDGRHDVKAGEYRRLLRQSNE